MRNTPSQTYKLIEDPSPYRVSNHLLHVSDCLKNAYLTLKIFTSAKYLPDIKINVSKFYLAHWKPTKVSLLCSLLLIKLECFLQTIKVSVDEILSIMDQKRTFRKLLLFKIAKLDHSAKNIRDINSKRC